MLQLTYFHTLTCNPHWPEFEHLNLGEHKTIIDCPDDVARVFHIRFNNFLKHLDSLYPGILQYYQVVFEWQQGGLPHGHIADSRVDTAGRPFDIRHNPALIDEHFSAEIPSEDFPEARAIVSSDIIHEPCGPHGNPNAECWDRVNNCCKRGFPKKLSEETRYNAKTGYVIHRRRSQPENVLKQWKCKHSQMVYAEIDNRYKLHSSIMALFVNRQACMSLHRWCETYPRKVLVLWNASYTCYITNNIRPMEYIFEYFFKLPKPVRARLLQTLEWRRKHPNDKGLKDSIQQFTDFFHCGAPESFWRLFGFPVWPSNVRTTVLPVHLPLEEQVVWTKAGASTSKSPHRAPTLLDHYFNRNKYHHHLLYAEYHRVMILEAKKPKVATGWISKDGTTWAHIR